MIIIIWGGLLYNDKLAGNDITPSHVYQETSAIIKGLEKTLEQNNISFIENSYAPQNRQPRHVFQKSLKILKRVDIYKKSLDLEPVQYPIFPIRDVKPANVLTIVDMIYLELLEIEKHFNIEIDKTLPPFEGGKTPSDVYENLDKIESIMDSINAPFLTPSDVFQVGQRIHGELDKICIFNNFNCSITPVNFVEGKVPEDVYNLSKGFFANVAELNKLIPNPIPGGVIIPQDPKGEIRPENVMDLINFILADLTSIKKSFGIRQPTDLLENTQDKTPSHVFQLISEANHKTLQLISELRNSN